MHDKRHVFCVLAKKIKIAEVGNKMDIKVLKNFLAVAREENITKAAAGLGMTQPALSRQMIVLEKELGVELFHRGKYRVTLTDAGFLLKRRAEEIVSLAGKVEHELSCPEKTLSGRIAIGSGDFRSGRILFDAIAAFEKRYPLVKFEIFSGNTDSIKEKIEQGTLDLGLVMEPFDVSRYNFVSMPVKESWCLYVPENHRLATKDFVTPKDLKKEALLTTVRPIVSNMIENWFRGTGVTPQIVASGNLLYNIVGLVRSGLGVSMNLDLDSNYTDVVKVPLKPGIESSTVLVWKKSDVQTPTASAFVEYLQECILSINKDNK